MLTPEQQYENLERRERAARIIRWYWFEYELIPGITFPPEPEFDDLTDCVGDLIADLYHWVIDRNLDPEAFHRTALMHVQAELKGE